MPRLATRPVKTFLYDTRLVPLCETISFFDKPNDDLELSNVTREEPLPSPHRLRISGAQITLVGQTGEPEKILWDGIFFFFEANGRTSSFAGDIAKEGVTFEPSLELEPNQELKVSARRMDLVPAMGYQKIRVRIQLLVWRFQADET